MEAGMVIPFNICLQTQERLFAPASGADFLPCPRRALRRGRVAAVAQVSGL